jgi:galactose mutarotase-like enzyme
MSALQLISPHGTARLTVVPERGGIITDWSVAEQPLLYLDWERFQDPSLSVRGGIPLLFPICGNLPDNHYHWEGQSYTLKQHGFARDLPWTRLQQTDQQVVLGLTDTPATRAVYPFPFSAKLTYCLGESSLQVTFWLKNTGDRPLPFSFGLHPYLLAPDKAALGFEIPCGRYQDQKTGEWWSFEGQFDWARPELDLAFRELHHNRVAMADSQRQIKLRMEFDPAFATTVFWTLLGKDYVCLEPWTAPRNALNSADDLLYLPAGADQQLTVLFRLESTKPS